MWRGMDREPRTGRQAARHIVSIVFILCSRYISLYFKCMTKKQELLTFRIMYKDPTSSFAQTAALVTKLLQLSQEETHAEKLLLGVSVTLQTVTFYVLY